MFRLVAIHILIILCSNILANRYAVIIGQNKGGKQLRSLRYAEEDARRFSKLLIEIGGFQKENVVTLLGTDSVGVSSALRKTSDVLFEKKDFNNSLFLFYYSGHADEEGLLLGQSRYSFEKLQKEISNFSSGIRIGIFDACQSGVVTAYKGGKRSEPFYLQNQQQVKGQVIIASSAATERAQESEALKGSVFSFHWLNGLRGSADLSNDRKVTLNEAYQYAYRKTVETSALATGEIQHPVYRFTIQGQGDIILTNLEQSAGGIVFDRNCSGKFLVLSENYLDVFADFYKNSAAEHFISLAPGKYTIINAQGRDIGTCQFNLGENKRKRIRKSDFSPVTLTQSRIKGNEEAENKYSSTLSHSPLSKFSWGIGTGVMMDDIVGKVWDRDAIVNWSGFYEVNNRIDFSVDLYGLINGKNAGAVAGIDYRLGSFEKGNISLGAMAGLEYLGSRKYNPDNQLSLVLSIKAAFTAEISDRVNMQLYVPYTVVINDPLVHRVGVGLQFIFSGRYRNVGVLDRE